MIKFVSRMFGKSINRMVISSFVMVLLLPVAFFVYSLFQNSWEQVEQDILEKHQLISAALVGPFTSFITTKQNSLYAVGKGIVKEKQKINTALSEEQNALESAKNIQSMLEEHLMYFGSFVALSFSSEQDGALHSIATNTDNGQLPSRESYPDNLLTPISQSLNHLRSSKKSPPYNDYLSPVFKSEVTGESVVLLKHHIRGKQNAIEGTIYAEVPLDKIANTCSQIKFGIKGHCAVIDSTGRVISHPNQAWVASVKDLSGVSVVKMMLTGSSGTTEFYSPFLKENVVTGYSAIPKLGWGVMIPQPKSEITDVLHDVQKNIFIWLLFGVLVALILAFTLTQKINLPIESLIKRTRRVALSKGMVDLGRRPRNSPIEIVKLWESFSQLLAGLVKSHEEVKRLNESLSHDINNATVELRQKNKELYKLSILDHLTSLPNRRYFTSHLDELLMNNSNKSIGVIFVDIDHFKSINDTYGHELGDAALIHFAKILNKCVRKSDLVARLGGDEFIIYIDGACQQTLSHIADTILLAAHSTPLVVEDIVITLSLSLGTVCHESNGTLTTEDFLKQADQAMYESKKNGRNRVTHYSLNDDLVRDKNA